MEALDASLRGEQCAAQARGCLRAGPDADPLPSPRSSEHLFTLPFQSFWACTSSDISPHRQIVQAIALSVLGMARCWVKELLACNWAGAAAPLPTLYHIVSVVLWCMSGS